MLFNAGMFWTGLFCPYINNFCTQAPEIELFQTNYWVAEELAQVQGFEVKGSSRIRLKIEAPKLCC